MSDEASSKTVMFGVIGGIIGGIVMAMPMLMMSFPTNPSTSNMLEMISLVMGPPNLLIGVMIHLMFSVIYGFVFGVVIFLLVNQFNQSVPTFWYFIVFGAIFGVILWIIGPLVVMPMMMGDKFGQTLDQMMLWAATLMGHLVYGVVLGAVFGYLQQRAP